MSTKTYLDEVTKTGEWKRTATTFRTPITADGSSGFKAESNRYHFYLSGACPWCHRVMATINLKGLEDVFTISFVDPVMGEIGTGKKMGWVFTGGEYTDPLFNAKSIAEIYRRAVPDYNDKNTVPVLWDKKTNTIVNNESSEIIKFLNSEFQHLAKNPSLDLRPARYLKEIETTGEWLLTTLNDRVYKTGFAGTQSAYEESVKILWKTLDELEARLSKQKWLLGDTFSELDLRAYVTLIRFDAVYTIHFKCVRHIEDYPHLRNYIRSLYQIPAIKASTRMDEIRNHYYKSHVHINPSRIVPVFEVNYDTPHNRDELFPEKSIGATREQGKERTTRSKL